MKLLNRKQVAELLGTSIHNVKRLRLHPVNPMPFYKRIGSKAFIDGKWVTVPKSVGRDLIVFEENEIFEYIKNR